MLGERPEQGWRRPLAAAFGFGLIALFVMAGALGVTLGVVIAAFIALPPWRDLRRLFPLDLSHSVFLIFIAWVWTSTIWSPYGKPDQAVHMALGAFFYPLFAFSVWTLRDKARRIAVTAALASGAVMILPYLLEGATGAISHFYAEGAAREGMLRDATRGISAIVIASPALVGLALQTFPNQKGRIGGAVFVALILAICMRFHLFAGVIALGAGAVFFAFGLRWPRSTILMVTLGFVAMVVLAPMLLPVFSHSLEGVSLPFSWEWRIKMWPYTGDQISERALFGWGLDASRTFNADRFELHGFSLKYLTLHPHNAGLQVWLETGLIGALILATTLLLFGMRLAGLRQLSPLQGAVIAGSGAVFLVFFSFTYGLWQEWLWASVAWVSALCVLIDPVRKKRPGA